jgi:chaperonin cofactor prefoldin
MDKDLKDRLDILINKIQAIENNIQYIIEAIDSIDDEEEDKHLFDFEGNIMPNDRDTFDEL